MHRPARAAQRASIKEIPIPRRPQRYVEPRAATADELFAEEGALERRLLATAMGLPRVCRVGKCRRRKECLGFGTICLADHAGLAHQRFPSALAHLGLTAEDLDKAR
jgi:hypothetical protein